MNDQKSNGKQKIAMIMSLYGIWYMVQGYCTQTVIQFVIREKKTKRNAPCRRCILCLLFRMMLYVKLNLYHVRVINIAYTIHKLEIRNMNANFISVFFTRISSTPFHAILREFSGATYVNNVRRIIE